MPRLSTPRMVPTPNVVFLPGMNAPGATNTPFMPERALGAPHTTCTGSPDPVSTMHTRSRSALGCGSAEITRAMENGASALPLSSTRSTSRPIMVSVSTIVPSAASVSRCCFSQERVNFIGSCPRFGVVPAKAAKRPPSRDPYAADYRGGRAYGSLLSAGTTSWRRSCAQPSGERRQIERAEAVMGEPAHVGLEESAQVRHAVFEHGDAVDPHAPGEALVLVGIEPAIAQHVGVHHPAAEDFEPVRALAEPDLALVAGALDVDLERRLGEREERGPEAHLHPIDLEEGF